MNEQTLIKRVTVEVYNQWMSMKEDKPCLN